MWSGDDMGSMPVDGILIDLAAAAGPLMEGAEPTVGEPQKGPRRTETLPWAKVDPLDPPSPLRIGPGASVEGDIETERPLVLGRGARVTGRVATAASASVSQEAEVVGPLSIHGSLRLGPRARVGPISVASGVRAWPSRGQGPPEPPEKKDG